MKPGPPMTLDLVDNSLRDDQPVGVAEPDETRYCHDAEWRMLRAVVPMTSAGQGRRPRLIFYTFRIRILDNQQVAKTLQALGTTFLPWLEPTS